MTWTTTLDIKGSVIYRGHRTGCRGLRAGIDDRIARMRAMPPCSLVGFPPTVSLEFVVDLLACHELGHTYVPSLCRTVTLAGGPRTLGDFGGAPWPGYVVPTSGSTGEPKLILGDWLGLEDYVREYGRLFFCTAPLRFAALTRPSFDPFLREIYTPLLFGHDLCIPDAREDLDDPVALAKWIREEEIQVLHLVPTVARLLFDSGLTLPSVNYVMLAGEPLFWRDVALIRRSVGLGCAIYNLYGPSETTLSKLLYRADARASEADNEAAQKPVPVGRPMGSARVLIVNDGRPCGTHEIGEIVIRHAIPSRGYLRVAGDTLVVESPFVRNPFASADAVPVYYTGDLGYIDENGDIVCVGRKDSVVKIRGRKVSLSRVEGVARSVLGVSDAIAKDCPDEHGSSKIVVFYSGSLSEIALKKELSLRLGDAELPGRLVRIEAFPRTHSGKLARASLEVPIEGSGARRGSTAAVREVADLYRRIIGTVDDEKNPSFFLSGGQSIDAAQIVSEVTKRFAVRLRLREFFELDTAGAVSSWIKEHAATPSSSERDVEATPGSAPWSLPILESQRRFVLAIERHGGSGDRRHRFQFPWACSIRGDLDVNRLAKAVSVVVNGSWSMNVRFDLERGLQIALDRGDFEPVHIDLRPLSVEEAIQGSVLRAFWTEAFDFAASRPIRAAIVSLADDTWLLFFVNHILASDGTTRENILAAVSAEYGGERRDACGYVDYHRRQQVMRSEVEQALQFWRRFPLRRSLVHSLYVKPVCAGARTRRESLLLTRDKVQAVRDYCARERVSVPVFLLHLLSSNLEQRRDTFGDVILISNARRLSIEDAGVIGCLTDSTVFPVGDKRSMPETQGLLSECLEWSQASFLEVTRSLYGTVDATDPGSFPVIFAPQPNLARPFHLQGCDTRVMRLSEPDWIWPLEVYPIIERNNIEIAISYADDARTEECAASLLEEIALEVKRVQMRNDTASA